MSRTGHMACYCPCIRCFDHDDYDHVAVDCPQKFYPQVYQHNAETTTVEDVIDPHLGVTIMIDITTATIKIGTGSADLNLAPIILDIAVRVAVTLTEIALDPFTDPHSAAHHASEAQEHTITTKTCHTDPHHAGVSLEITVDPGHAHPTNTITKPQEDHLPAHIKHPGRPRSGNTSKSLLMTHPQNTIALMNRTAIQRLI